jgi:FkbM family methyltransferase
MRGLGFAGRIVSFEPVAAAFTTLSRRAADDALWDCHRLAVGDLDGYADLNVAEDSVASSVFHPGDLQLRMVPQARCVACERVPIQQLTSLWPMLVEPGERVYLKVDVEGFELAVLRGAGAFLREATFVETELSVTPLYEGGPLLTEVMSLLADHGFAAVALEHNGGDDPETGQMLMIDGIFGHRADEVRHRDTKDAT